MNGQTLQNRSRLGRQRRRGGMIFVVALAIVVILTALVLAFAQSMRSEALASANRRSAAQADAIELGAEQWVLAQIEAYAPDAINITTIPAQGVQLGGGYFWILTPNWQNDQQYQFGITDEKAKVNINLPPSRNLINLPWTAPPQEVLDSIDAWQGPAAHPPNSDGAQSSYYQTLSEPYQCKNLPFESVEELLLVQGVTPQMLFGYDLNRDGVIDAAERAAGGVGYSYAGPGSGNDTRGVFNYLTCYTHAHGNSDGYPGAINVNTAPAQTLACLNGITLQTAQAIVLARQAQGDTTSTAWARQLFNTTKGNSLFGPPLSQAYLVGASYQYSADIVAVSGDGRAFRRVRIVVDADSTSSTSSASSSPKILYRRDLTSLGWPLPPSLRDSLRAGKGIPAGLFGTNLTNSGTIGQPQ